MTVDRDDLPWRFVVPMPDASLSGEVERGAELVFQVGYPPRLGKPMLVEHRATGRRYVRLYAEGPHGWRAIATSTTFLSFERGEEEVDILATMRWRD